MNILLTGASGFLGQEIGFTLMKQGHAVRAASRQSGIDFVQMLSPADWLPYLNKIDAVINCAGIIAESRSKKNGKADTQTFAMIHTQAPIALFQACVQAQVRRVIQISAIGADANAFSAYHQSKFAADLFLSEQDLDWLVLRPSLVYGLGSSSTATLMRFANLPVIPVVGDGEQALQPIHVSDVVACVLNALTAVNTQQTLDLVGGEVITYVNWLQTMRLAMGKQRAQVWHLPETLVKTFLSIGRYFNPLLHPDNLRMLQANYQADVKTTMNILGRAPKRIAPRLFFTNANEN